MRQEQLLRHRFVEFMPEMLEEQTLYVSMQYAMVMHKCCCGCGNDVVTPLSPIDWKLIFDGKSISLDPSIGNWGFACQSHYWIKDSMVIWTSQWSQEKITAGRAHDRVVKERYFASASIPTEEMLSTSPEISGNAKAEPSLWQKFKKWWLQVKTREMSSTEE